MSRPSASPRFNLDLEKSLVGVNMMYEVLDLVPELQSAPDAVEAKFDSATVSFDKVEFAYGDAPVLRQLSLTAPANSVVALVGPSGAGKSTVFSLVEALLRPEGRAPF